jgi:hypothetical protein
VGTKRWSRRSATSEWHWRDSDDRAHLTVRTIDNGRPLDYIVSGGLGGNSWGVYKRRPGERSIHRLTSPLTPIRETPEDAEIDLAIYAATRLGLPGPTRELVERYRGEVERIGQMWREEHDERIRLEQRLATAQGEARIWKGAALEVKP